MRHGINSLQRAALAGKTVVKRAEEAATEYHARDRLPQWVIACGIGIAAALLALLIRQCILGHYFDAAERSNYDRLMRQQALQRPCQDPHCHDLEKLIVIAIDPASEKILGRFPWPRSTQAMLVRELKRTGFSVIGIDELFDTSPNGSRDDAALAAAASDAGNVVWQCVYPDQPGEKMKRPLPVFPRARGSRMGFANLRTDDDNVWRAVPARFQDRGKLIPSFALAVIQMFYHKPAAVDVHGRTLYSAGMAIPLDTHGDFRIRYSLPSYPVKPPEKTPQIKHLSCTDFITLDPNTHQVISSGLDDNYYKGKIAIVGRWDQLDPDDPDDQNRNLQDEDLHLTPWSAVADMTDPMHSSSMHIPEGRMYGVDINAEAVLALLDRIFIYPVSDLAVLGIMILLSMAAALIASKTRLWVAALPVILMAAIYNQLAVQLFIIKSIWLELYMVLLALALSYIGVAIYEAVSSSLERWRLYALFSRYVAPKVARRLLHDPQALQLGAGRNLDVTVLFCDIRNFTSRSEKLQPVEVLAWLNEHLGAMVEAIHAEDGTVDKYVGDAIMAVFGAPEPQPDHAARALRAALSMSAALDILNEQRKAEGLWTYEIGIGLQSGPAVTGSMGHPARPEYAVLGDTVNTSSRIESLTKEFHARVLVSGETCAAAGEIPDPETYVGEIPIRGRDKPVKLYKLVDIAAVHSLQPDHPAPPDGRTSSIEDHAGEAARVVQ